MSSLPPPLAACDPLVERLERLSQRRAAQTGTTVPGVLAPPSMPVRQRATPQPDPRPGQSARTPRRRHPAKTARLGALIVSCASAGGLAYLFAGLNTTQAANTALAALPAPVTTSAATATSQTTVPTVATDGTATTPAATTPAATPSTAATTPAVAAVTAYDGGTVDTRYGPVQVQVQITDGAISEVAVVQYPDGDGKSVRINARALPTLRSEVLSAQSANIDTVSGATYTSDAYKQSLQSAIDQARAAGAVQAA